MNQDVPKLHNIKVHLAPQSSVQVKARPSVTSHCLPTSEFSPVPGSQELFHWSVKATDSARGESWGQTNCSHLGEHSLTWARIATSLATMSKDEGNPLSFSSFGIFMRNFWVYSIHNGPLQSRNITEQQHQHCFLFIFSPSFSPFSLGNGNLVFQNLWRENTSN